MLVQPLGGFIHVLAGLAVFAVAVELALGWRRKRQAVKNPAALSEGDAKPFDSPAA